MCRLLYVRSSTPFRMSTHLKQFAAICKNSKEFQGHGWGCAWLEQGVWKQYKNINPVWEDDLERFTNTTALVAHARSAFRNRDIHTDNNMPFIKDDMVFAFNGELHGVRIREQGRTGAHKIFNYIHRFRVLGLQAGLEKAVRLITTRSKYIRAMNIILADHKQAVVATGFNEDEAYFSLHTKQLPDGVIICSQPYANGQNWQTISNHTIRLI